MNILYIYYIPTSMPEKCINPLTILDNMDLSENRTTSQIAWFIIFPLKWPYIGLRSTIYRDIQYLISPVVFHYIGSCGCSFLLIWIYSSASHVLITVFPLFPSYFFAKSHVFLTSASPNCGFIIIFSLGSAQVALPLDFSQLGFRVHQLPPLFCVVVFQAYLPKGNSCGWKNPPKMFPRETNRNKGSGLGLPSFSSVCISRLDWLCSKYCCRRSEFSSTSRKVNSSSVSSNPFASRFLRTASESGDSAGTEVAATTCSAYLGIGRKGSWSQKDSGQHVPMSNWTYHDLPLMG